MKNNHIKAVQFNWLHPIEFIRNERNKIPDIHSLSYTEYGNWIRKNGFGMNNLFTDYFEKSKVEVVDYFWSDELFREKLCNLEKFQLTDIRFLFEYFNSIGLKASLQFLSLKSIREKSICEMKLLKNVLRRKADIIFIREPAGVDHRLLSIIKRKTQLKVICLLGCEFKMIANFNPLMYDTVFTISKGYASFFESFGRKTFIFKYACYKFSDHQQSVNDIVFVGDLAADVQKDKTELMNAVGEKYNFKWWGPVNVRKNKYPSLYSAYQGITAGNKMLDIYATARIVLNDYPANLEGEAVNMRIWDAISSGSFLITRDSANLSELKKAGLAVFNSTEECLQLINFWLNNNIRESVALKVKKYCSDNYNLDSSLSMILSEMKTLTARA